jgi:hypothetical protein
MSKATRQFLESIKQAAQPERVMEALGAVKDGIQAVAPGLSVGKVLGDIGTELKQQVAHGGHETAAALFNGSAFVMYPRHDGQREDPQHGLPPVEAAKQPEAEQEQSRGGIEM